MQSRESLLGTYRRVAREFSGAAFGNWRSSVAIGHLAIAPPVLLYFFLVLLNGAVFGYRFWYEPAPSRLADLAAVISVWLVLLLTCACVVIGYGWMCRRALDDVDDEQPDLWGALHRSWRPSLRRSWYGAPAIALCAASVMLILPSPFVVGTLGSLPLPVLDGVERPVRWHFDRVGDGFARPASIALMLGVMSLPLNLAFQLEESIRAHYEGWALATAIAPIWFGVAFLMMGVGAAVVLFTSEYRQKQMREQIDVGA